MQDFKNGRLFLRWQWQGENTFTLEVGMDTEIFTGYALMNGNNLLKE